MKIIVTFTDGTSGEYAATEGADIESLIEGIEDMNEKEVESWEILTD